MEFKTRVKNESDIEEWEKSEAYDDYIGFITAMNKSVTAIPLNKTLILSDEIKKFLRILNMIDDWITEVEPLKESCRFGNKAFSTFYNLLKMRLSDILSNEILLDDQQYVTELTAYIVDSFGNPTRIDYGTGHELSFCMFLCGLYKINILKQSDSKATVNVLFSRYLEIVRRLQLRYQMEPAGSHGAWSLDDYQFVPFIWGSAQLIENPDLNPNLFVDEKVVQLFKSKYMFLGCIDFIMQVKKGVFHEHSNQLWNISGVQSWNKINEGLIKMYKKEVLGKFPIIQHVPFGKIFQFKQCDKKKTFATSSTIKVSSQSLLEKLKKPDTLEPNIINK
ncbi:serine/threonine-protein phosphatase 2A activator-like isoform X2 [Sipha flava]|nr:serine/threonine-protein phosphatase 2A activator-like isoform X2 [Sipha flava]XP_025405921.1 serine/threonine-protein phosphatase 2A activator-like isoform X2 [Sipha flava]